MHSCHATSPGTKRKHSRGRHRPSASVCRGAVPRETPRQKSERAISWGDSPHRGVHVLRAHGAGHRDLRHILPPRALRLALAAPPDITIWSEFPRIVRRFASPYFTIPDVTPFRRDSGPAFGPLRPELFFCSLPNLIRCYLMPVLDGSLDHRPSASFDWESQGTATRSGALCHSSVRRWSFHFHHHRPSAPHQPLGQYRRASRRVPSSLGSLRHTRFKRAANTFQDTFD